MAIGHLTPAFGNSSVSSSVSVSKPTGAAVGQYCIILVTSSGSTGFNTPAGFTALGSATSQGALFGRVLDGTEGSSFTITITGSLMNLFAICDVVTGCDPVAPLDAVALTQASAVTTLTLGQITATSTYLWSEATRIGSAAAVTPPASMTSVWSNTTTQAAGGAAQTISPGATGTRDWTWSGSSTGVGFLMSLKPASVGQKEYMGMLTV